MTSSSEPTGSACPTCGAPLQRHQVDVTKLGNPPGTDLVDGDTYCPECSMTLTQWLRLQLDADERVALAATGDTVVTDQWKIGNDCVADDQDAMVVDGATSYPEFSQGIHAHIAAWDPARVLAEVKAKRAILDDCAEYDGSEMATDGLSVRVVEAMAQPYAGRDGWQHEWSATE
jgi:hypothetical protein